MEIIALLVTLLIIVILQNWLYDRFALTNVTYTCYFETEEANEGDEVIFVEEVSNAKLLPLCWLRSELTASKWLVFPELQSSVTGTQRFVSSFFMMKSYHRIVRRWKVTCSKRGVYSIDKTVLVATDLFGNVNVSMPLDVHAAITVLPKPLDIPDVISGSSRMQGDTFVRRRLLPDPFFYSGVREYSESEPSRRISWTATAHVDEIMVFNDDYTADNNLAILLNVRPMQRFREGIHEEWAERCIKAAAAVVYQAAEKNISMRFLTNALSPEEEPYISYEGSGANNALEILRLMASIDIPSSMDFDLFLRNAANALPQMDIVVISCYVSEEMLLFARKRGSVRIIQAAGKALEIHKNGGVIDLSEAGEAV